MFVDVADESAIDAESAKLLQPGWEAADLVEVEPELLVLLLTSLGA